MRRATDMVRFSLAALLGTGCVSLAAAPCAQPVYLTFDTGHMAVAPLIAEVLQRHHVSVTFFAAHEKTQQGDGTLGQHWASWWKARAAEGHAFASHTWDHAYWRADVQEGGVQKFRIRPSAGEHAGQTLVWTAKNYCDNLRQAARRLRDVTGQAPLPLFRAPGGKTSDRLLAAGRQCGFAHVGWADAGFLGDELPSSTYPNAQLLQKALRNIRSGDILMAHLGIWSRQDPWAPAVLEPLIVGLKARGLCFATLREHPDYRDWIRQQPLVLPVMSDTRP
jgi:peptidoglycan/xylan/chitin deacetylase (PgdA/CDA1 family)